MGEIGNPRNPRCAVGWRNSRPAEPAAAGWWDHRGAERRCTWSRSTIQAVGFGGVVQQVGGGLDVRGGGVRTTSLLFRGGGGRLGRNQERGLSVGLFPLLKVQLVG